MLDDSLIGGQKHKPEEFYLQFSYASLKDREIGPVEEAPGSMVDLAHG